MLRLDRITRSRGWTQRSRCRGADEENVFADLDHACVCSFPHRIGKLAEARVAVIIHDEALRLDALLQKGSDERPKPTRPRGDTVLLYLATSPHRGALASTFNEGNSGSDIAWPTSVGIDADALGTGGSLMPLAGGCGGGLRKS